ncbi:MAG: glycosyltransferase family 4 protein [Chitinispirillaceae bacterium]|nr:glycosyltransferase family 4 protein [Chitinispirillaceae bacterium]
MNTLLINYELPPVGGGAGNATWQIARALVTLGHEASVLTVAFNDRTDPVITENVRILPVPAIRKKPGQSNLFEMASFVMSALSRSTDIAEKLNVQAAIVFFTLPCAPIAFRLKKRLHIPYIISMQGGDVPHFVPSLDPVHFLLTPLRRKLLRESTAAVANSFGLKKLSEQTDPFDILVIPNGIDAVFYSPAEKTSGTTAGPFRVLFAGRFHTQKNVPALLHATRRLMDTLSQEIELHLVGEGPEKNRLVKAAEEIGMAKSIRWHGWVNKEKLRDLYRYVDCFVNPSFCEGMPNTVLEAMACGLPVIASDVIGNQELVVHEETGFLFPVNETGVFAEQLGILLHNRERARLFGQRGRKRAVEDFSWERTAQAYLDLFHAFPAGA